MIVWIAQEVFTCEGVYTIGAYSTEDGAKEACQEYIKDRWKSPLIWTGECAEVSSPIHYCEISAFEVDK